MMSCLKWKLSMCSVYANEIIQAWKMQLNTHHCHSSNDVEKGWSTAERTPLALYTNQLGPRLPTLTVSWSSRACFHFPRISFPNNLDTNNLHHHRCGSCWSLQWFSSEDWRRSPVSLCVHRGSRRWFRSFESMTVLNKFERDAMNFFVDLLPGGMNFASDVNPAQPRQSKYPNQYNQWHRF